ncbi:hypothetical protein C9I99_21475 [Photobacterium lutimaris]|uniref:Uncharacterized protein n=2 Tax=Photobacterium lutimaris TaxID=388278 RepID=A0A2T3ITR9_9GAMM|nr:hypothetical protein C9I99_21475 [Photobacterium lutimaris]
MTMLQVYKLWNVETQCPYCGTSNYFAAKNFHTNKQLPFQREKNYEVMCGLCEEEYHFRLPPLNQSGGKVKAVKVTGDNQPIQSGDYQPVLSGFKLHITLADCEEYEVGIVDNDSGKLEAFQPNDDYVVVPHGDNGHILGMYQRAYNDVTKVLIAADDILNVRYEPLQGQAGGDTSSMYFEPVTG